MLDQLVEAVRGGESRTLVVRGEPGVGKTALLDYVAERAPGCRVVRTAGVQSEMELAFAGLHQLLTPLLDPLERLPVPQRDALRTTFVMTTVPWRMRAAGRTNDTPRMSAETTCGPVALDGRSSSEIVAELVAGARVVKAANTLPAELLGADPRDAGCRRVLSFSGDDAKATGGPLAALNLVRLP